MRRVLPLLTLAALAACADLATDPPVDVLTDAPLALDDLDGWDTSVWEPQEHPLGRGWFRLANVTHEPGRLLLHHPAGTRDGGEIRSTRRYRNGAFEAVLRTPSLPGSVSAFFLYEGVVGGNDEIDIEIFNDGSRRAWFVVWADGREAYKAEAILPFDPADGFHTYRIERSGRTIRWLVDGVPYASYRGRRVKAPLHMYVNTWWPTWLEGPLPATSSALVVDRLDAF